MTTTQNLTETPHSQTVHWTYAAALSDYMSWFRQRDDLTAEETATAAHYSRELARLRWETREQTTAELTFPLTEFQADEVSYGMEIDSSDGYPDWGRVDVTGRKRKTYTLTVCATQEARDGALYRITSLRDICLDNAHDRLATAGERRSAGARGRSLAQLTARLVEACGGPEGFSPDMRRWITY